MNDLSIILLNATNVQKAKKRKDVTLALGQALGQSTVIGKPFLHRSLVPLNQVDFSTEEDRDQLSMFNNECEGMCGV